MLMFLTSWNQQRMVSNLGLCVLCVFLEASRWMVSAGSASPSRTPGYLWPLGNTTVHREVMKGHDAHLPDASQCFVFQQGYPGLPYDAITLRGTPQSFVDFHFSGELNFRDLSLSLYIYPEGPAPQGIVLSYKCATGNVIRLSVMQGLFFVNFWDEYGVSVGMTAVPNLLNPDTWNHVVLIRQIETGTIKVYHDGELVEDLDDDFPNGIRLPVVGSMRLGRGQEENEAGLAGRYTCFQMFPSILTRDDVREIAANCRPESWKIQPEVHLETRMVGDEEKQCVTDYSPRALADPADVQLEAVSCTTLGIHCVTGSVAWTAVMRKHNWLDSGRETAYYYMVARGMLPANPEAEENLLGQVPATDRRVCSRLCMRVKTCLSFAFSARKGSGVQCHLYKAVLQARENSPGTRYYALRKQKTG